MTKDLVYKKLTEEKSFELGLQARNLPLGPTEINKEYYNLGLKLFHIHRKISYQSQVIRLASMDENSFWKKEGTFKNFKLTVEFCAVSLLEIDKNYKKYFEFKEKFKSKNKKLIDLAEDKLMMDLLYDTSRNMYVIRILEKKEKFNLAYRNLFSILKSTLENKK